MRWWLRYCAFRLAAAIAGFDPNQAADYPPAGKSYALPEAAHLDCYNLTPAQKEKYEGEVRTRYGKQ
jgi:hypothetical protein